MTNIEEDLKNYILRRVEKRTGERVTWEELLKKPLDFGGAETVTDILESGLVESAEAPTILKSDRNKK